ncbi:hypothetical protein F5B22DRAFT_660911 [Xylaria bambusicola]|uniref:uncharacterized protein n=1 Tax=Xylaria bambusicola TaxID=326684 RepID=UPI0020080B05|nr:uncharacterized protein F5B22DRAFT_660911 [Xylaria bambusicola]KAI0505874.1 hypothetical protein F5B22DRAFT_660911 [Xylaria bambusicola]
MANGSKKFHSKSRNCKRRRVRCNCQGPICSNCHRRNELCDYLRDHNPQVSEIEGPRNHIYGTSLEPTYSSRFAKPFTARNEQSYFSCFTDLVIALDYYPLFADKQQLLANAAAFFDIQHASFILSRDMVPTKNGNQKLPYLLPTISSLCAIHKATQHGCQSLDAYAEAVQHNIAASANFRHAEYRVHEGNWLPLLLFGVSHIIFNFAAAQSAPDFAFDYLGIFHVLRSSGKVGNHIGRFLEKSELSNILQRRRQWTVEVSLYGDSLCAITQLSLAEHPKMTSRSVREHCEHALEKLKWWVRYVRGTPRIWRDFILWPGSVTDGFVTALMEKQPVALLIYIYWCVIMRRAPRRWYAESWHLRVANAAMSELGPEYAAFLEWPMLVLGC